MIELLYLDFFRNAIFISITLSILFGILSFFVIMKNMTFLGAGISHAAFGGVAFGIFAGIDPFISSIIFCVIVAILIGKITKKGEISADAGIGIFFSFSMALGAIFIALKKEYTFDLMGYLFGNILGVTSYDNIKAIITLIIFLPFIFIFFHKLLFVTFDEDVARVSGINSDFYDTILFIMMAVIIVVSIKIVGIILISALVVLPASFGKLFSKNFRYILLISVIYTLLNMITGLFLSYYLDTPTGATMVVLATIVFFTTSAIFNLNKRLRAN